MGAVNLKVNLGTINYTNWVHITASKVSSPSVIAWENWLDTPVTNYNFIIPNLDPENYYVRYYDAPTDTALGTLVAELIVNALTNEVVFERRFYTCGGSNPGDPADGDAFIQDDYLIGKTIYGTFKEAFRPYVPGTEFTFDDGAGRIDILNGTTFSGTEVFCVEIKYIIAAINTAPSGGLYSGSIDVSDATKTLLIADRNKRVRCVGTAATQVITFPASTGLAIGDGYYIDNSIGGTAVQVKLLFNGTEKLRYNGFAPVSNLFGEFWVSKGEHVLIRKEADGFFELITDYKGTNVGLIVTTGFKSMPGVLPEDGKLYDGEEYPRLWWWINNVLPSTHIVTDVNVVDIYYVNPIDRPGQFVKHPTLKKFRVPNSQALMYKGLADYNNYNGDIEARPVDYPGGYQEDKIKKFWPGEVNKPVILKIDNTNTTDTVNPDPGNEPNIVQPLLIDKSLFADSTRVQNIGCIFGRCI